MSFALFVLLHGCGNVNGENAGLNPDGTPIDPNGPVVPLAPMLTIDTPAPVSYLPLGAGPVGGGFLMLDGITVNGSPATLAEDGWSASHTFVPGMNVLEVIGTDADGQAVRDLRAPLAGTFQDPSGFVDSAIQVHIGAAVLDVLLPMADGMLDPAALADTVTALNPVLDDGTMVVNATGLDFTGTQITAIPTEGLLEVAVSIEQFTIPLDISGAALGVDEGEIYADQLILTMGVALGTDSGRLTVDLVDPAVEFVGFDFSVNNFIANWFVDADAIEAQLQGELDTLMLSLPATLDDMLAGLDLSMETDILDQTLQIEPRFSAAGVEASGIYLGMDLQLDVIGVQPTGDGHLVVGSAPRITGDGLTAQLGDDFMNRFLHELWAGGALDIDLPIVAGDLAALLLTQLGGVEGADGALHLVPRLPPVWVQGADGARLQLSEIDLTVDTPGGIWGDQIEMLMTLDAGADIQIDASAVGVVLSGAQVKLVPRGANATNADLLEIIPGVEATLGLGMGSINEMLSFDLSEMAAGAEPLVLPPIDVSRDASGKATDIGLSVEAIVALITGVPVEPIDPSDPADPNDPADPIDPDPVVPGPMDVAVPSDAVVYDYDGEVQDDGAIGWICRNDDIEVFGNGGTWYVDDRGEVVVNGTGHTIYVIDDGDVILNSPGNTVYYDPGATVDDNDGTNTLIEADPLTFDLSAAPGDGC